MYNKISNSIYFTVTIEAYILKPLIKKNNIHSTYEDPQSKYNIYATHETRKMHLRK